MFTNRVTHLPFNAYPISDILHFLRVERMNEGIYECQGELDEYYEGIYQKVKFAARAVLIGRSQHYCIKTLYPP